MYCGSCLRDNAMATELLARGHDVLLLPVYTPTHTDEPNVSQDHVALGGISASGGLLQRSCGLPDATVSVLQGILFVVILASETYRGKVDWFSRLLLPKGAES